MLKRSQIKLDSKLNAISLKAPSELKSKCINKIKFHHKIKLFLFQVAHNCFRFDAIVLQKNLKMFGLPELPENILFADTMDLMRDLKQMGIIKGSISLKALVKEFSIKHNEKNQHDAWEDTKSLIKVAHIAVKSVGFRNFDSFLNSKKHFMQSIHI